MATSTDRIKQTKTKVTNSKNQIKHAALVKYFRHGLLPLLDKLSKAVLEEIKKEISKLLGEYGLRTWSFCAECEVDPKYGFVHIRRDCRQEVIAKIKQQQPFCPNELFVLVVHHLKNLHSNLRDMCAADLILSVKNGQTSTAFLMSKDFTDREFMDQNLDIVNERMYDEFVTVLESNVKLDLIFKNHCEVLKAFSAKGPYKNVAVIEDLPVLAVVSVISNCNMSAKYLNMNLKDRHNLLSKVTLSYN